MDIVKIIGVMIPIVTVVGGIVMIIFLRRYQHMERINMIERGMTPNDFKDERRASDPDRTIRNGLLAVGAGLGLFVGQLTKSSMGLRSDDGDAMIFGLMLLFGGIGLVAAYFITEKKGKNKGE
ncbi:MAG: hypothetical protein RL757_702 [Bacteroidota bacterium]|jgi:hypothetical protein